MKTIKHSLLLAAMTLLLPTGLKAQLKTIEVQNHDDYSSVVRRINDTAWLVCNNSNGSVFFSRVNETQPMAPQLELAYIEYSDSMHVNDFVIFRDTVYFCGQSWDDQGSVAIWGYFPLSTFPYVNVMYRAAYADNFRKIKVFSVDTTTADLHVVMIGSTKESFPKGVIYDEVRESSNVFDQYVSSVFDTVPLLHFDDLEVTDLHIAVASNADNGSVLFLKKPTLLWTSIFSGAAVNQTLTCFSTAHRLEYCNNDNLVVAYKLLGFGIVNVLLFNQVTPQHLISIDRTENFQIVDMEYNETKGDLDLLTRIGDFLSIHIDSSIILHLNSSLLYNGGPIFCHKYISENLNSLAWLPTSGNMFVASGHDVVQHHLRLYKYPYDNWGKCAEQVERRARKVNVIKGPHEPNLKFEFEEIKMWELNSYPDGNPLRVICD